MPYWINFFIHFPNDNTDTIIGNVGTDDVLFVVYTERVRRNENGIESDVIRIISARYAANFERGLYYGKY
ncbi:MAG: BrnT family toxin [Clostridiales bacterium]|nr:BrnT family toxin [Clostridiales bacterium]